MDLRVVPLGDAALLILAEPVIDLRVNQRLHAIAADLTARRLRGVRDVVPAYASCAVHFDPLRTDRLALRAAVEDAVARSAGAVEEDTRASTVEVPVCYGGEFGPDLPAVAAYAASTEADVVRLHAGRDYRVFMIGFLPGFPYLAAVDDRIAMPRRDAPRPRVPAGSVGVAGRQTGIYPVDAPGGWQIIGRTPLRLFDPHSSTPSRFAPGDLVRFVPIDEATYRRLAAGSTD
ncbi:MAG TPA: 5-oxoprolinase subunit PxpB [Vicinamibacterales bacterium]|nr:5-oxoprolinase subunit PxpB [Vicinamibacterales bacterium]